MCIGIPMRVMQVEGSTAWCEGMGERRRVDTLLLGPQAPGTWLLVFLDSAREVLSEAEARRTAEALQAVQQVMQGGHNVDHLFADLVDREPELPAFLQPPSTPVTGD
jgi:hydrogenase expression/formation protein HypC